jgi:hypothetical protein
MREASLPSRCFVLLLHEVPMFDVLMHPKLVHIPVTLAILMPFLAGGVFLAWLRGWFPRRTWIIVAILQGVLAVSAFTALKSGEVDEEIVENVVSEDAIEEHAEYAEKFLIAGIIVFLLAAAGAAIPKEGIARGFAGTALLGTLIVFWLAYETGEHGGKLVYELGAANAHIAASGAAIPVPGMGESGDSDDDDDDD